MTAGSAASWLRVRRCCSPSRPDGQPAHLTHAYGHDITLDACRLRPERVAAGLSAAEVTLHATTLRQAVPPEPTGQAYLFGFRSS